MNWTDRVGRRIKLRDLHILLAVAKSGSMGKAAADLAVSQPVVSKAISDLEYGLGVRLLDRTPRGAEPTLHGQALLRCGVAVFDDLRQGVKALEFLSDPTAGELRLGCTEPLAAGFVGAVCGLLCLAVTRIGGSCAPLDGLTGVGAIGGVGGVCAWAFTHQSDSTTAIDAKTSDSIAAPEPDHGSPPIIGTMRRRV